MSELLNYFENQRQPMIELLTELINHESFTGDKARVDELGTFIAGKFDELGASSITRLPQTEVGDNILAKWNEDAPGSPILFLMHMDTVHATGALAERPVRIDGEGRLFGPGSVDMKGGITVAMTALDGLRELGQMPKRPLWALATSDEEIGSPYSEQIIRDLAAQCGLVLVMEPATLNGAVKTWRKGIATYHLAIEGRASHAGGAPKMGINSIIEFAQQALKINELNDSQNGTSAVVTMVDGGSARNVVPAKTSAYVDTRALRQSEMDRVYETMMSLRPILTDAKITVTKEHSRPPMEHNELVKVSLAQAEAIAKKIGLAIHEGGSGGGSDGNFTAAMGIPTLDGLGPQGGGAHSTNEFVLIETMSQRATLVAGIVRDWVMKPVT